MAPRERDTAAAYGIVTLRHPVSGEAVLNFRPGDLSEKLRSELDELISSQQLIIEQRQAFLDLPQLGRFTPSALLEMVPSEPFRAESEMWEWIRQVVERLTLPDAEIEDPQGLDRVMEAAEWFNELHGHGTDLVTRWPEWDETSSALHERWADLCRHYDELDIANNVIGGALEVPESLKALDVSSLEDLYRYLQVGQTHAVRGAGEWTQFFTDYQMFLDDTQEHFDNATAWNNNDLKVESVSAQWRDDMREFLQAANVAVGDLVNRTNPVISMVMALQRIQAAMERLENNFTAWVESAKSEQRDRDRSRRASFPVDEVMRQEVLGQIAAQSRCLSGEDTNLIGTWMEFLCVDLLNAMGMKVTLRAGAKDGGVDIEAAEVSPTGEQTRYLVQVKYKGRTGQVTENEVAQFFGKVAPRPSEYDKLAFLTAGRFHEGARGLCHVSSIEMWDGVWLCRSMIQNRVMLDLSYVEGKKDPEWRLRDDDLIALDRRVLEHHGKL